MTSDRQVRIVLAEDDPDLRLLLCEELEDAGYAVTPAADGQQALEALRDAPADLIISDVMMPQLDGIALYEAVQRDPGLAALPFVFLTALRPGSQQNRLSACHRAVTCPKPIDFDALLDQVASLLAKRD